MPWGYNSVPDDPIVSCMMRTGLPPWALDSDCSDDDDDDADEFESFDVDDFTPSEAARYERLIGIE